MRRRLLKDIEELDYLTFTCTVAGSIGMTHHGTNTSITKPNILYNKNDGGWVDWDFTDISMVAGDVVKMRGHNESGFNHSDKNYSNFYFLNNNWTSAIYASGNIMSLIDGKKNGTKVIPCNYCFYSLFSVSIGYHVRVLRSIPSLPATTLKAHCYHDMFSGCSSLGYGSAYLPATELQDSCYYRMFSRSSIIPDCSNIDFYSPEVVASGGLKGLFYGSYATESQILSLLPINPVTGNRILPCTTLSDLCYSYMFYGCYVKTAPELPATILKRACYMDMFAYSSLINPPQLASTDLAVSCYHSMFEGCKGLRTIINLPATVLKNSCYYCMFDGCTNLSGNLTLPATTLAHYCYFQMHADTLLIPDCTNIDFTSVELVSFGCLAGLFSGTNITDLFLRDTLPINPDTNRICLPCLTLGNYCYYNLFSYCENVTIAPELPATELKYDCYNSMFCGCTALTTAPELPATTLTTYCYFNMFWNCKSLTVAPELPATTLSWYCYRGMFELCSGLTIAPALPATILVGGCYNRMFSGCTNLTIAPALPATILAGGCYRGMFSGCTNLTKITCLLTNIAGGEDLSTYNWVSGVAATGTFVKSPDMHDWPTGVNGIPEGWTVEDYLESA